MSTGGAETLIGAPCETARDCDASGLCIKDGRDGLCSQTCAAPGRAGACPLGSFCDRAELASDVEDKTVMIVCLPACKEKSDCRAGYSCNGLSSGPGKVCRPD